MAKYNTFIVYDCKKRKNILVTSSARKAKRLLKTGIKIEIWSQNILMNVIYLKNANDINEYVGIEKQYIAKKQANAELKNKRRKSKIELRCKS